MNPKGATNSQQHDDAMRKLRLDNHTVSAYLIAVKGTAKT